MKSIEQSQDFHHQEAQGEEELTGGYWVHG